MSNNFFTKTGNPANNSAGSSSLMRAEFASIEAGFDKMPTLTANGSKLVQVNSAATALEATTTPTLGTPISGDATNLTNTIAPQTHAATSKATPVDADELPLSDSAATFGLKKLTWANLKATILTWLQGTVFPAPGAIGSTTPSTGAFTTLSASGAATFQEAGNTSVVIRGGSGQATLNVNSGSDAQLFSILTNPSSTFVDASAGISFRNTSGDFAYSIGGAEKARISSTGLAVTGALSSTGTLKVQNPTKSILHISDAAGTGGFQLYRSIGGTNDQNLNIYDYTLGADVLQLSSGNLGLGITPSAWASNYKAIDHYVYGAVFGGSDGATGLAGNAYYNGTNWIYKTSNTATKYEYGPNYGAHIWSVASAGTAGAVATFTQAMTLTGGQDLGVGETSPNARFEVVKDVTYSSIDTFPQMAIKATTGTNGKRLNLAVDSTNNIAFIQALNRGTGEMNLVLQRYGGEVVVGSQSAITASVGGSVTASGVLAVKGALSSHQASVGIFQYSGNITSLRSYGATAGTGQLAFNVGGGGNSADFEAMRLDASGNLGLGVTPSAWGSSYKATQLTYGSLYSAAYTVLGLSVGAYNDNTNWRYAQSGQLVGRYEQSAGQHLWYTAPSGTAGNAITFTQAMTLDASGNHLVGLTSIGTLTPNGFFVNPAASGSNIGVTHGTGTASGVAFEQYFYNGTVIGSISQNGTTAVAYNTTSDHRLKENVRPANAARFMDIEFVDFEWVDGRHDCGVIADQLQSVYPDLVLGEKDATEVRTVEITPAIPEVKDEDGNVTQEAVPAVTEEQTFPVYQQVNYIGLIGRMGTRVQQLQRTVDTQAAIIAAMEARLTALEAA